MAKGRIADNKPKVIARLEKRVRRGEGSVKLLEYEAWVVDWLRENPLPHGCPKKTFTASLTARGRAIGMGSGRPSERRRSGPVSPLSLSARKEKKKE
jgi:hypothetical protein